MSITMLILSACFTEKEVDSAEEIVETNPLPEFVDDCNEGLNEDLTQLAGIVSEDEWMETGVQLCTDDKDVYQINIPPQTWTSVEITIDGSGKNETDGTDLDLWEIENPDAVLSSLLDLVEDEEEQHNLIWYSATEESFERLAWYNPTDTEMVRYVMVDGWDGADALYDIRVRTSAYHEGMDCDSFYEDVSEDGPCNQIQQFPQANTLEDGYIVSHQAKYSNLRREVAYLVRHAAADTAATFPDTKPLGLLDMSQFDGDTPGRDVDQLRHPEGTHVYGNDIDIAYYQTGDDNLGRAVCPDNDGYFCTGDATLLDARRTAYFMIRLIESPYIRVIGVDPVIADAIFEAADELKEEGIISASEKNSLRNYTAYGDGWPFHHHHLHFSWAWEDGTVLRSQENHSLNCGHTVSEHKGWPEKMLRHEMLRHTQD